MIEILETPELLTDNHAGWDGACPRLFSVFAEGRRIFSFSEDGINQILASRATLTEPGVRICLDGDAADDWETSWLERQGDNVVVLRGSRAYTAQNILCDERVALLQLPFAHWMEAVDRFAILLAENNDRKS